MNRKLRFFVMASAAILLSVMTSFVQAQTEGIVYSPKVTSDKPDYQPRSTAVFTGIGFKPYEEVVLRVKNLNRACNTITADSSYLPWTVKADASGGFVTNWIVCDCWGDSLRLKATGQESLATAYAYFTDGSVSWSISVLSPSPSTINLGQTKEFTFSITSTVSNNDTKDRVGCVKITLPSGFTPVSGTGVITSASVSIVQSSWTVSTSGQVITVSSSQDNDRLAGNTAGKENLQFKIQIKAGTSLTVNNIYSFPSTASEVKECTKIGDSPTSGSDPSVKVESKLTPNISVTGGVFTYTGTPHGATGFAYGNGGTEDVLSPAVTLSYTGTLLSGGSYNSSTAPTLPGNYIATASFAGNSTYASGSNTDALIIDKAGLTVTADPQTKVYGAANPSPLTATISGFVNGETLATSGVTGTASVTTTATQSSPVGSYTLTAAIGSLASDNYSFSFVNGSLSVTKAGLTVTADDKTKAYGAPIPTLTVHYDGFVNGDDETDLGGTLSVVTTATASSIVGHYPITASGFTSSNYTISYRAGDLEVTKAAVCIVYNGDLFANTSAPTNTATLNLSAVLTDNSSNSYKDITTATVSFEIYKLDANFSPTTTTPIATVTGNIQNGYTNGQAVFSNTWTSPDQLNATSNLSVTYMVIVVVGGNYVSDGDCSDDEANINVSYPTSDFVTGGGYIIPVNTSSSGADNGRKNNFGFNVKYNNKMTNLQGNFNTQIRRGGKLYHIKSNSPSSLTVDTKTKPYKATMYFKSVVIQEIQNDIVVNSWGNNTAVVQIVDNGEPGSSSATVPDQISIVIRDKNGVVYYSNTASPGFALQSLAGGNVQVRTSTNTKLTATKLSTGIAVPSETDASIEFNLRAYPNPSNAQFTLQMTSSNKQDKVQVRIMDMSGRVVQEFNNLSANQTIQVGASYRPGMYIVEMIQGENRKQLKLIKQPD